MNSQTENYLRFYLSKPFWAVDDFDVDDPNLKYTDLISEVVFTRQNKYLTLKICRNGMFFLKINQIETLLNSHVSSTQISKSLDVWSTYLKYANSIALMCLVRGGAYDPFPQTSQIG